MTDDVRRRLKAWLWRPPRPHGEVIDRSVSFLELFYDLVYVAVIAQAAHHLAGKRDWDAGGWADDFAARTGRVNSPTNLTGACAPCNASKGARQIGTGSGQWWPQGWPSGTWWPFGGP